MANFAGLVTDAYYVDSTYAIAARRFVEPQAGNFASLLALDVPISGPVAAGGVLPGIPVSPTPRAGVVAAEASPGLDWFDRIHLLKRGVYNFGLILSQETDTYEVFNAWRQDVTLLSVTNSVGASVTLPGSPTPPAVISALTSLLDPSSTHASGASKNKTPLTITVAKDGPPSFSGTIQWAFSTGSTATLSLTGIRVSLIPAIYESEFEESWRFPTDTVFTDNGTEQVVALTANPVQSFSLNFLLDAEERQRMQALLMGAQAQLLALPLWHEDVLTTASVSVGATSVAVTSTTDADYRVGGYAVIWTSPTQYDVVQVSAVGTNLLSFASTPTVGSHLSGARVAPVRLGFITTEVPIRRYYVSLDSYTLQFRVTDNDTGMFAGSTASWGTYSSKVVLDDPNIMDGTTEANSTTRVQLIDNETGVIEQIAIWQKSRRGSQKGFSIKSRSELMVVKKLLLALRGPQVSFRLPTFAEDITVVATLTSGNSTMDISHIGYTKYVQSREPKKVFRVTFTDGTTVIREAVSSVEVSNTVERITIDTGWATTKLASEVRRVEFLEPVRFDTENFSFRYLRSGWAKLAAPVKTLMA